MVKIILSFIFLYSFHSFAQTVEAVKGKKIRIAIDDIGILDEGSKAYAFDEDGKKKAIVLIQSNDGTNAIGVIEKGNVEIGYTISRSKPDELNDHSSGGGKRRSKKGVFSNVGGRFISATASSSVGSGTASGTGFGFLAEYGNTINDLSISGEFRYSTYSWQSGGSNTGMDFGLVGKYRSQNLAFIGGFAPISQLSGNGSSISGTTLSFGLHLEHSRQLSFCGEYRMTALNGINLNSLNLGVNWAL